MNTENSDGNEGIFGKLFGFLGFGGADTSTCDIASLSCSQLSPEEVERQREQIEKRMTGWWSDDDIGGGGSISSLCDSSHPALNPPLFLGEYIPPPDG